MWKLVFNDDTYASVELGEDVIRIGRDEENEVVLTDEGVSGFHAEIRIDQNKVYLTDLGSTNGTKVNGQAISGRHELVAWDVVEFDTVGCEVVDAEGRRPTKLHKAIGKMDLGDNIADPDATVMRPSLSGWVLTGRSSDIKDRAFVIDSPKTVGRSDSADIVIDNPLISRKHARFEVVDGALFVEDLGSANGTFVNGSKITRQALSGGDSVKFDETEFLVSDQDGDRTAMRQVPEELTGLSGYCITTTEGRSFDLLGNRVTLGRTPATDITIEDGTVSVQHAAFEKSGEGWEIQDLGSTNGTMVNGLRVERQMLNPGDQLKFGEVEATFELKGGAGVHGTQLVGAVGAGFHGTQVMGAVGETSEMEADTEMTPVSGIKKQAANPWVWGVVSFAVVGLALWYFLLYEPTRVEVQQQIEAPLQAALVWSQQTESDSGNPTTPVLADINNDSFLDVIIADSQGFVMALDGAEGKKIFRTPVDDQILAPLAAADLNADGKADVIAATNGGRVMALNEDGQFLWRTEADLDLGAVWNRPALAQLNEDPAVDVVVPTTEKGLVALDGNRGWEIWNTSEFTDGQVITSPAAGDFNADGAMDFAYLTDRGQLVVASGDSGRVWKLWEAPNLGDVTYASPLYLANTSGGLIVVATGNGVTAFGAASGRVVWAKSLNEEFFASPLGIDANGDTVTDVILTARNGNVYAIEGQTGDEIWTTNIQAGVRASPTSFDANNDGIRDLIFADENGRLMVFDTSWGRSILEYQASENKFLASPLLGDLTRDRLLEVLLVSEEGEISAIGLNRIVGEGKAEWPVFLGGQSHAAPGKSP